MKFYTVLESVSQFAIVLPIVIGAIRYKHLTVSLKKFYFFLIFSALVELLVAMLAELGIQNSWIVHLYTPIEFYFISHVLYSLILDKKIQRFIKSVSLVLIGIWIVYFIGLIGAAVFKGSFDYLKDSLSDWQHIAFSIEAIFLIAFSILLLVSLLWQERLFPITESKSLWFALAVLIYFIGNIILYPSLNVLISNISAEASRRLWIIHSIFNFIHYLFFSITFLCRR